MAGMAPQARSRGNPWVILIVVSLGFFMTLLDLTIVNIAIPNMISKLHASLDDILWVINAYALVLAVLLITAGRLGDLLGQRTVFFAGIALFTVASAACGFAPSPGWLIGFRAVQGLGAALLMPQTLAILTMVFPAERRGAAFGVWGAVAGVATIAGPTLGGLLVTAFDWRYIFFINVPIGMVVLVLTPFLIPDLRTGRKHSFDIGGVVLASLALLAICYALVEGQKYNWGTIKSFISIPLLFGVGVVLLGRVPLAPGAAPGRRAARTVRPVQGPELLADEHGVRVHRDRHARHLPAVLHLPSVRARLLRAQGRPDDGAGLADGDVRRAGRRPDVGPDRRQVHPDGGPAPVRRRHGLHRADRPAELRLVRLPRCRRSSPASASAARSRR